MRSEIVSIGTEILMGQITDTNASWLAQQLPALGIDLLWVSGVGDNLGRLSEVLDRAFKRSDLVICTGGLGPTEDDITREAIAAMLGEDIFQDARLVADLRAHFGRRGNPMPERNLRQATRTASTMALPNPRGTAPGWWSERDGHVIVAMPGVPHEMRFMWETQVVPRLQARLGDIVIHSRLLKVIGLGESAAEERIRDLLHTDNPSIGTYAKEDGIHLRLTAKAKTLDEAKLMVEELEIKVRAELGMHVYGADDDRFEGVVGKLLLERQLTLATMESCTGGLVANVITNEPGSSAYFKGGFVSYTNAAKIGFGVPAEVITQHGAVSAETALEMATAARQRLSASVGLAVTGVAGPSELEGKPAGTVHLAIDVNGQRHAIEAFYPLVRIQMKRLTMLAALDLVRRTLLKV
ncbi:MAG TPA: competence/damage-inducible protein A [Chloroflexota bacterium]|nr:competence/damage-inducible protein A [Chloroflexota bacterium]